MWYLCKLCGWNISSKNTSVCLILIWYLQIILIWVPEWAQIGSVLAPPSKLQWWRFFSHRRHPEIIILIVNKLSSNSVLLVEVVSNSDSPVWDFEIPKPIISQSHPVSGDIFICQTKYKTFSLHHNFLLILEIFQSPQLESGNLYLKPGISWMCTYLVSPGGVFLWCIFCSVSYWHILLMFLLFFLRCIFCIVFPGYVHIWFSPGVLLWCISWICAHLVFSWCISWICAHLVFSWCISGAAPGLVSGWLAPRDTHSCSWTAQSSHHHGQHQHQSIIIVTATAIIVRISIIVTITIIIIKIKRLAWVLAGSSSG